MIIRICAVGVFAGAFLLAQTGDAAKGKALVESSGCLNCHRIEDKGPHTAPELTDICGPLPCCPVCLVSPTGAGNLAGNLRPHRKRKSRAPELAHLWRRLRQPAL